MVANTIANLRVLGMDIRPRRLGYVCLEGRDSALESGVTEFASIAEARRRIEIILEKLCPTVLVLRHITPRTKRDEPKTRAMQRLASKLATRNFVEVVFITKRKLKSHFPSEARTKYQIASLLAQMYPELAWRLPLRRKPWLPEHRNMLIFDAAALVVTYFACCET